MMCDVTLVDHAHLALGFCIVLLEEYRGMQNVPFVIQTKYNDECEYCVKYDTCMCVCVPSLFPAQAGRSRCLQETICSGLT